MNHYVKDTINIAYVESNLYWPITNEVGGRLSSQFVHQRSVGDDNLTGSSFDTWVVGAVLAVSWKNTILRAAFNTVDDEERVLIPEGPFTMGTNDRRSSYDNERPAHEVEVPAFALDRFPVSARRYGAFIEAGGYTTEDWWSTDGWSWNRETGHGAPQGWTRRLDGGWEAFRFGRLVPVDPADIVQHVSYWEAEAFCAFVGGRLPTEAEWEKAAAWDPGAGRSRRYPWGEEEPTSLLANVNVTGWGPSRVGDYPSGASAYGVEHMLGDTFEWTSSVFDGYPGFVAYPYKEYSEVFFPDRYPVLRGAAWATNPAVARNTFRNWDLPERRQIFSGIRVAWDVT